MVTEKKVSQKEKKANHNEWCIAWLVKSNCHEAIPVPVCLLWPIDPVTPSGRTSEEQGIAEVTTKNINLGPVKNKVKLHLPNGNENQ